MTVNDDINKGLTDSGVVPEATNADGDALAQVWENDKVVPADSIADAEEKKSAGTVERKSTAKKLAVGFIWLLLTPVILFIILAVLLYLPPVQKFVVDRVAEFVSEETGMDVSVERVALKFPLDLSIGGVVAVQECDTVLNAGNVEVSVKLLPLFKEKVEVDAMKLTDTKLDTRNLIAACRVSGEVGEFSFNSHSVDMGQELAVINFAQLRDSRVNIVLADSVPEDTTVSEPSLWKVRLDDVYLHNVSLDMSLAPSSDSVYVGAHIGDSHIRGYLDLGKAVYQAYEFTAERSALSYDVGKLSDGSVPTIVPGIGRNTHDASSRTLAFDPNHIFVRDFLLRLDSVEYKGTGDLHVNIKQMTAREQSGLEIQDFQGVVEMDSTSLRLPHLYLRTADSDVNATAQMDLNAFDELNPGQFRVDALGHFGKDDIIILMPDMRQQLAKGWPSQPLVVALNAQGNMKRMTVDRLQAYMNGMLDVKGKATLTDVADSLRMGMDATMDAKLTDVNFVKELLPGDVAASFLLPRNMTLSAKAGMRNGKISMDAELKAGESAVMLTADCNPNTEEYLVDMGLEQFRVGTFMPLEEDLLLAGSVFAEGKGFDVYSPKTTAKVKVLLDEAKMGQIDLGGTHAEALLENGDMALDMDCDNELIRTAFVLKGRLTPKDIAANLNIDLPFIDIQGLGFAKERLELSTKGRFDFTSNMNDIFMLDSHVDGLRMLIGKDSVRTEAFDIFAETTKDSTSAVVNAGDLSLDFHTPNNLFVFMDRISKCVDVVSKQVEKKELELDKVKAYMPVASLKAYVGSENPLARITAVNGLRLSELQADVNLSPESGIAGKAYAYGLTNDTIKIDTVFFNIRQDSSRVAFHSGVKCNDQKLCPGFTALLDGYADLDDADVRLQFFNRNMRKGVDLGLKANVLDSVLHVTLYPSEPIIAFSRFGINQDNFVDVYPSGKIVANVRLASKEDSCTIELYGVPDEEYEQNARAVVRNLDIAKVLTVVPFLPDMGGMLNVDARYTQTKEQMTVESEIEAKRFTYEKMLVGDLKSNLFYLPAGKDLHDVTASLALNGVSVANVKGTYDDNGEGALDAKMTLDDFPMSVTSPFIPDQIVTFNGNLGGEIQVSGPTDKLMFDGYLLPEGVKMSSDMYALDIKFSDDSIRIADSRLTFDKYELYGAGNKPLTLNGYVDFADMGMLKLGLSLYGRNFQLIDAKRTRKAVLFGKVYGDFFARVTGTTNDLLVRGLINVLSTTDMTYIMTDTPLSVDYRLDDIVTFVDFTAPPDTTDERLRRSFTGMDMQVQLMVEDGAQFHCEFSADKQSYINVQGGGSLVMNQTPEGVLTLQGKYTVNEGEMKYSLPVIPLKTFTIKNGSYIEFTGVPENPTLNITATERTNASVTDQNGRSRTVAFDVGLKVTNTLENMGLEFTIDAPEDMTVKNELASYSAEEKNKLAVGMLATGMYLSGNNSSGFNAGNALNSFLQSEITNIAGQALSTAVDVNLGMEQNTREDGSTQTDYSFKFSKRFFSNRLNVVIGGKVSADGDAGEHDSGAYIDDISLEWRLDNGGSRYVRLFHEKNYDNLIEGELIENGVGVVFRKKMDRLSELFLFKNKKTSDSGNGTRNKARKEAPGVATQEREDSAGKTADVQHNAK